MSKLKKALTIFALICGLIGLIGFWGVSLILDGMCGNDIVLKKVSPDNKHNVFVFNRDCGATTGFSTQISILDDDEELDNESGNLFISEGYPSNVIVKWVDSHTLEITGTGGRIFKKEKTYLEIKILYPEYVE